MTARSRRGLRRDRLPGYVADFLASRGQPMHPMIDEPPIVKASGRLGDMPTTHRVRMCARASAPTRSSVIMLDAGASCGLVRRSRPALPALAMLSVLIDAAREQGLALGPVGAVLCAAVMRARAASSSSRAGWVRRNFGAAGLSQ